MILHVYPLNDLMEHATDGTPCPCEPRLVEESGGIVMVHRSCDGREKDEDPSYSRRRKPSTPQGD